MTTWKQIIRGEWWLVEGEAVFADQSVSDKGHAELATDYLLDGDDLLERWREWFEQQVEAGEEDPEDAPDWEELESLEEEYGASALVPHVPARVGRELLGQRWHEITDDSRTVLMRERGAIRVTGLSFEVWKLGKKELEEIQGFLLEEASEEGEDDVSDIEGDAWIEEWHPKRRTVSIPISELLVARSPSDVWRQGLERNPGDAPPTDDADLEPNGFFSGLGERIDRATAVPLSYLKGTKRKVAEATALALEKLRSGAEESEVVGWLVERGFARQLARIAVKYAVWYARIGLAAVAVASDGTLAVPAMYGQKGITLLEPVVEGVVEHHVGKLEKHFEDKRKSKGRSAKAELTGAALEPGLKREIEKLERAYAAHGGGQKALKSNAARYYVWELLPDSMRPAPYSVVHGPYELESGKTYARISATHGRLHRGVSLGIDPLSRSFEFVRIYEAGTGERLV